MTDTTDLAAVLNECMPITSKSYGTLNHAENHGSHVMLCRVGMSGGYEANEERTIGILWGECVRRQWKVVVGLDSVEIYRHRRSTWHLIGREGDCDVNTLAFARAFAAAKKATNT